MTFKVCYWDDAAQEQRERDSTPDEDVQAASDLAAENAPVTRRAEIQEKIDDIERETLENRGSRELHMAIIIKQAMSDTSSSSPSDAAVLVVLSHQPYFLRLKSTNDQIVALRAEMAAL